MKNEIPKIRVRKNRFRKLTLSQLRELGTISVEEAAYLIGISRTSCYEAVKRGDIQAKVYNKTTKVLAQPLYAELMGNPVNLEC